jgi:hypothetical protein
LHTDSCFRWIDPYGELGRIAEIFRTASAAGLINPKDPFVAAAYRDLAEMRTVCFLAMGREP